MKIAQKVQIYPPKVVKIDEFILEKICSPNIDLKSFKDLHVILSWKKSRIIIEFVLAIYLLNSYLCKCRANFTFVFP